MEEGTYDLQLHSLPLQLNRSNLEIDSNGADVALGVCIVCKPEEQARLSRKLSAVHR